MDKKSKKIYIKAMEYYQNGKIDKAIDLCEKGISLNIKNSSIINLKGLLLYLKGDLKGARALWSINKDANGDEVAKKYIADLKEDMERERLYNEAIKLLKELKVTEALGLLEECKKSDFNTINVSNAITICYIKQGQYNEAKKYIDKVLALDLKNNTALDNKRMLMEYGIINREIFNKKVVFTVILVIIISLSAIIGVKYGYPYAKNYISKIKDNKNKKIEENIKKEEVIEKLNEQPKVEVKEEAKQEKIEEKFPYDELKAFIDSKDYNSMYNVLYKWKDKSLAVNDKILYSKAEELMKSEGVEYFYKSGSRSLNSKEYVKAKEDLEKAYYYSKGSYLEPHIIYLLALSVERSEDFEKAIKYYELYASTYSEGEYIDAVLYNLAMIYKNVDINKSKEYAKSLTERFPNSIYNNTNIKSILE